MLGGAAALHINAQHASTARLQIRFLIMDPHYTGPDDVASICPKWVGWKSSDTLTHLNTKLFKSDTFYSFCLPQRPADL